MFKKKALTYDTLSSSVLDSIPDMVRVIGADRKVIYANSILKSLGNSKDEMCRKIPGSGSDCRNCIAVRSIKDNTKYSSITRSKGKTFSLTACPVLHNGNVYALEVIRDITHEQDIKEKLMTNNSRMMNDLEIARSLQLSILRHNLPKTKGYQFCAEFLPCEALGGDMYDCFIAHDGRVIMYVADVSGHGVMPAMLTVYLRQEIFAQCKAPGISPLEVLKNLQASFEELNTEESIYITVFLLALDPSTGEFVYANAGHSVPPLIAGTEVRELFLSGTPICRWAGMHIREESKDALKKGERLFLYTDGLDGIHTGFASNEKLKHILVDPKLKGRRLLDEIKKKFTQAKADDVTMVLCERE